ncbi:MAG: type II secretion system protein [Patescibacteria group bacterium]
MFAKRTKTVFQGGFTLVEIIFAVAIISVSLIGVSAIISMSGNQATRIEDEREASELALSVKTCVGGFGIPYLRSVADGGKTEIWFGSGNTECLTGRTLTGSFDFASSPKIRLETSLQ